MFGFHRDAAGRARFGSALVADLMAEAGVQTPAYVYDLSAIRAEVKELVAAFGATPHLVAYAVKANSAGSVVRTVREAGGGADVVSGGELRVALGAGVLPEDTVMSGVGKADWELDLAIATGIYAIQVESVSEVARVASRARALSRQARVSLRVNPSVRIDTHAHIATGHDQAKFGIAISDLNHAWECVDAAGDALRPVGLSMHIGSMMLGTEHFETAATTLCQAARARLERAGLEFVDFGGGFGIDYGGSAPVRPAAFVARALELCRTHRLDDLRVLVEPGRSLVGAHGVLVAKVLQTKQSGDRRWLIIDAGMNDLLRPALYGAKHRVEPLDRAPGGACYRVVGPVCESSDDFGVHEIGDPAPEQVVIRDAGAYGFSMASEYNGRALPAELFVDEGGLRHVSSSPGVDQWVARRLGA